jgi:hypothetical protein
MFSAASFHHSRFCVAAVFAAAISAVSAPALAQAARSFVLSDVLGSAAPNGESWLVVTNHGESPQSLVVDVHYPVNGIRLTQWRSAPIRPQTSLVVAAREIELSGEGPRVLVAPLLLNLRITGAPSLSVQHLLARDGTVRADAGCGAAVDGAPQLIGNMFGASAQPSFVSVFEATNTSGAPLEARVVLLDPLNGLPTYAWIDTIPGYGTQSISIPQLEARIGAVIGGFWSRYTARVESDPRIVVRHKVMAGSAGVAADATATCALAKVPEVTIQIARTARRGLGPPRAFVHRQKRRRQLLDLRDAR